MKLKNKTKKRIVTFFKALPYALFYIFDLALLLGAILVVVQLFTSLSKTDNTKEISIQILVGIGASLLSLVIGITGLVTFIVSSINSSKNKKDNRIEKTTSFIKEFNNEIIIDLNIVTRIMKSTSRNINWDGMFDPLLVDQKTKFDQLNKFMADNKIIYKEKLYYNIAEVLFVENNLLNSVLMSFCETVLKEKISNAWKYSNSKGAVQLLYLFKRKRIRVLNYFENLAVCFINETIDTDLVIEQFKHILLDTIPLLYFEVYRLEGLNSYPYLNKMLKIMQEK